MGSKIIEIFNKIAYKDTKKLEILNKNSNSIFF